MPFLMQKKNSLPFKLDSSILHDFFKKEIYLEIAQKITTLCN